MTTTPERRTSKLAYGRWTEILLALGVEPRLLNHKNQPCPGCGGKDRFRYTDYSGAGSYFCSQCGPGSGFGLLKLIYGWNFGKAATEIDHVLGNLRPAAMGFSGTQCANPRACRGLYELSSEIDETDPVGLYLRSRKLDPFLNVDLLGYNHKALRYVPALRYHADHTLHPGMIAVFSDANGKASTIHRTYLTADGKKAVLEPNRMFMAGNIPPGGAIRLSRPDEDITHLGVAEGIETALSARQLFGGMPVWATTGAPLLKQWQPPPTAMDITIFSDNDDSFTGQAAAYALANRLTMEAQRDGIQRKITVRIPAISGTDFNDVLQQGGQ